MGGKTQGFVNGEPVSGFDLKINHMPTTLTYTGTRPVDLIGNRFEASASITVDNADAYKAMLANSKLFTLETTTDLNPHHQTVTGLRAHVRRALKIVRWHWQKLIRKPLPSTIVVTVPNVRAENIILEEPPVDR